MDEEKIEMIMKPKSSRPQAASPDWLTAVVANAQGEIFDLPGFAAVGADGPDISPLRVDQGLVLPYGGELMYLPDRHPLVYDLKRRQVVALTENPFEPGQVLLPVAAFNSPGYVITHNCAYEEAERAGFLPLFSYGAVGWHGDNFHSALIQVDREPRQDLRRMPREKVLAGVKQMQRQLPHNRLRAHLEKCALTYGCPAGKNFFLGRYEAPLPTAITCNARCLGCLSLQAEGRIHHSQDRISFTPTADEIAAVALTHIQRVPKAVVSFGQGCEGDPLMAADTIIAAVSRIRTATAAGTINMNTNGSLPDKIQGLIRAGVDSLRISINSVRRDCYQAYFRPKGYRFEDVLASIDLALAHEVHVAINYLNCPGFSDTPEECQALLAFLKDHPLHMIQWRNLNFDPRRYVQLMNEVVSHGPPLGMRTLLDRVRQGFPNLRFGYFNPPKENFRF
jgi:pyruvate-formate lyase-activating enzyme